MKKIRIGNDFSFAWAIERNGVAEDFSTVLNMALTMKSTYGVEKTITDYTVVGNIITVEVTPELTEGIGRYRFTLSYELPDVTLSDSERLCTIDTDAFIIVPRTAEADDSENLLVTSDMAIGFRGKDAYEVWLETNTGTREDYIASIKGDPGNYGVVEFVVNENMELEQHTLVGEPLDFSIVDGDLVLNEAGETVNFGTVAIKDTYSYDEQRIGTWVNGKPIYRKVILLDDTMIVENSIIINHNLGIDEFIRMDITSNNKNNQIVPVSALQLGGNAGLGIGLFDVSDSAIYLNELSYPWTEITYHLILEYTKLP